MGLEAEQPMNGGRKRNDRRFGSSFSLLFLFPLCSFSFCFSFGSVSSMRDFSNFCSFFGEGGRFSGY